MKKARQATNKDSGRSGICWIAATNSVVLPYSNCLSHFDTAIKWRVTFCKSAGMTAYGEDEDSGRAEPRRPWRPSFKPDTFIARSLLDVAKNRVPCTQWSPAPECWVVLSLDSPTRAPYLVFTWKWRVQTTQASCNIHKIKQTKWRNPPSWRVAIIAQWFDPRLVIAACSTPGTWEIICDFSLSMFFAFLVLSINQMADLTEYRALCNAFGK